MTRTPLGAVVATVVAATLAVPRGRGRRPGRPTREGGGTAPARTAGAAAAPAPTPARGGRTRSGGGA
jgi:hypothetical protein